MIRALETLHALHALDDDARLSRPLGERMAELPTGNAFLSTMLLESTSTGCAIEIATVVAMLSVQSVWAYSSDTRSLEKAKQKFAASEGDLITYLNVWRGWVESKKSRQWSYSNFINHRSMLRAADIRDQLLAHLQRMKLPIASAFEGVGSMGSGAIAALVTVCKTMAAGLFLNAVRVTSSQHDLLLRSRERAGGAALADDINKSEGGKDGSAVYALVRGTGMGSSAARGNAQSDVISLKVHRTSVLYRKSAPAWLCFFSAQQNDSGWYDMHDVVAIDPGWLMEIAPHYFVQLPAHTRGGI